MSNHHFGYLSVLSLHNDKPFDQGLRDLIESAPIEIYFQKG